MSHPDPAHPEELPRLSLLHTGDLHLGEEGMAQRRLAGLAAVVAAAAERGVDALLIAGDLFDHARVRPRLIDTVLETLAAAPIPVVLAPGNHDHVGPGGLYRSIDIGKVGPHVTFFGDPDGTHVVIDDLLLDLWARGLTEHSPQFNPLEGHTPGREGYFHVVLAHGFYVPLGTTPNRSSPILHKHIESTDADYVALGHWHRFTRLPTATPAAYSGAPAEYGPATAKSLLVTLTPGSIILEPISSRLDLRQASADGQSLVNQKP